MLPLSRCSLTLQTAITRARHLAAARNCSSVETGHLFMGLLQAEEEAPGLATTLLEISGVSKSEARVYALSSLRTDGQLKIGEPFFSSPAHIALSMAMGEADKMGHAQVGTEHLLIACVRYQRGNHVGEVLRPLGLDANHLRSHLREMVGDKSSRDFNYPLNRLSPASEEVVESAHQKMRASFCGRISTAHLLLGLLEDETSLVRELFAQAEIEVDELKRQVQAAISNDGEIAAPQKKFAAAAKRALERARDEADRNDQDQIEPQHLLFGLLPQDTKLSEKFAFGGALTDPLEEIWANWPIDALKKQYAQKWRQLEDEDGDAYIAPTQTPSDWVKVRYAWLLGGVASCVILLVPVDEKFLILLGGFGGSIFAACVAAFLKQRDLRDQAASYLLGLAGTLLCAPFLLLFLGHLF